MLTAQEIKDRFKSAIGHEPTVVARAPGRVNLIGEHTDYNDGFVFPLALDHNTWVAAAPRSDGKLRVISKDIDEDATITLSDWDVANSPVWMKYVGGVVKLISEQGGPVAADLLISSDVPVGGGLSSSAALELSTATAMAALGGVEISLRDRALLGRRAEHEFAGVPCGYMDQMISALAKAGHAMLLDTRTLEPTHVPLPTDTHELVIVNSGVRHELASGEYAKRQKDCQVAVAALKEHVDPNITALRDANLEQLNSIEDKVDPIAFKRARHVITEDVRTLAATEALKAKDYAKLGPLLLAAHASIRDDYEVSCKEVDVLVEVVAAVPGVVGARMTGGGFGGCVVAFAEQGTADKVEAAVRAGYDPKFGKQADVILTGTGSGATLVEAN